MLHRQTKLRQSECLRISQPYLTELKSSELRMTKKERNEKRTNKRRQSCYRFRWKRTFASLLFLFLVFKLYSLAKEGVIIHIALWKALDASEKASVPIQKEEDKIPKVAMLFLSTNPLHNEPIWRAFFEAAGRLSFLPEPPEHEYSQQTVLQTLKKSEQSPSPTEGAGVQSKDSSREEQTNSGSSKHRRQLMTTLIQQPKVKWNCTDEESMIQTEVVRLTSKNTKIPLVIQNQNLFSVNSAVVDRIDTKNSYAQFTLVAATIQLLRVALRNPLNKKFILLSESCIPIRPPEVIHAQLITEKRSRVHACQLKSLRAQRWDWRIIEQKYWRKSSQFFALRRDHAEIAVEDEELQSKFKQYCFSRWEIRKFCVSDEHFFGTLLAKHGRENETDCRGYLTSSEWGPGKAKWHPRTYKTQDVNIDLIKRLGSKGLRGEPCSVAETRASTGSIYKGFSNFGCTKRQFEANKISGKHWVVNYGYRPLYYPCPLFSRKFPADAVEQTLKATLSCDGAGLGFWC